MRDSRLRPDQYRKLLLSKKAELTAAPRMPDLGQPLSVADDDQATILHDRFVAARIEGMDYQTIKLIDLALDRLESQEFGVCLECGETISAKRLIAIPWATLCISCQERAASTSTGDERAA